MDVSGAMLTVLKEKSQRLGIENIGCVQGGFLTYEHRGEPADFVYSRRNSLRHLPDPFEVLALQRIASILGGAGGALRLHDPLFSFDPREAEDIIEA